jgi:hypothetical protein
LVLSEERHPYELARTGDKNLAFYFLFCPYHIDGTGKCVGPVIVRCKQKVKQVLHELRIILVPGVEESQLAVRVIRLDRLDTGELLTARSTDSKFK